MATIANLVAKFTADTTGFEKGGNKMNATLKRVGAGIATFVGINGLAGMTRAVIDEADQIGKLSERLGISTEALSQFEHVANLSGVSFSTLTTGLQRMTRRIAEVGEFGKGAAKDALDQLGLSAKELIKLAPEDQYEKIADALNGLENQSLKVALAMKIFDTEGVSLLQTMGRGAQGIRDMRMEADKLGQTLSKDQTDAAAKANDAFARLDGSMKGLRRSFGIALAGPIADVVTVLADVFPRAIRNLGAPFRVLGELIGGTFALAAQFYQANFRGAFEIAKSLPGNLLDAGRTTPQRDKPEATDEDKQMLELQRQQRDSLEVIRGELVFGVPVVAQ